MVSINTMLWLLNFFFCLFVFSTSVFMRYIRYWKTNELKEFFKHHWYYDLSLAQKKFSMLVINPVNNSDIINLWHYFFATRKCEHRSQDYVSALFRFWAQMSGFALSTHIAISIGITLLVERRIMIEKFLVLSTIPDLAILRRVLGVILIPYWG